MTKEKEITVEEVVKGLVSLGFREYPSKDSRSRSFSSGYVLDGPDCECNDRPPHVRVEVYDFLIPGHRIRNSEFKIFGESNSFWCKLSIYTVPLDNTVEFAGKCKPLFEKLWKVYTDGMKEIGVSPRT